MLQLPSARGSYRRRHPVVDAMLWFAGCLFALSLIAAVARAAPGINLSWDECGAAGSEIKTFACNQNSGAPFTLVASFVPPSGIQEMVGLSADMRIASTALPDWWKHGKGQCRGLTDLATDFDFTAPGACTDFMHGRGAGGFLYEVGSYGANTARLRVQAAIPYDEKGPLAPGTEYYAFKVRVPRSNVTGAGNCAGCDVPVSISLREIQLFQPLEAGNDPVLLTPLVRTTAFWQAKSGSVPVVTAFAPASGTPGTVVTITGNNFTGASALWFGAVGAEFSVVSNTEIRATVPALARNGTRIVVDTPHGSAISANAFGLPPQIVSIFPEQAPVGATVAIRGRNFENVTTTKFNGVNAAFTAVSDSIIRATVPVGATTGPISVVSGTGTGTSATPFRVGEALGSLNLAWNDCSSAGVETKSFACAANTQAPFTLIGSFVPPPGVTQFFGVTADLTVAAGTLPDWWKHGAEQCRGAQGLTVSPDFRTGPSTCIDPWRGMANAPFSYNIDPNGTTARIHIVAAMPQANARALDAFREYYGFKLNVVPTRVTGSGACSGCDTPVNIVLNQIQLMQPAALGQNPIITAPLVRNSANWQGTPGPRPRVDSFTPLAGAPGTVVTITGVNFGETSAVRFGGSASAFTRASDTQLIATLSADAQTGPITVHSPYGTGSGPVAFIVAPRIAAITPAQGAVGTSVQIQGTNFTSTSSVTFNGTSASYTVDSNDLITTTVPVNATSGPIVVLNPGGSATSSGFVVTLPVPRVDSFSPAGGAPGSTVAVRGANFIGASRVQIGGVDATHQVVSDTRIDAIVPVGARSGPVLVTGPGGTNATSPTFIVAPIIELFTPVSARVGSSVVIRGANLGSVTRVAFGSVTATFSLQSEVVMNAVVPESAVTGPISVTNIGGTATSAGSFTVLAPQPPVITSFSPTQGAVGYTIWINGDHLSSVNAVRFNGVPASFIVFSTTTMNAVVPSGAQDGFITVASPYGIATSAEPFFITASPPGSGSINLSWDDCGLAGARNKNFSCNTNSGVPFTLIGSFDPPSGISALAGISADMAIGSDQALPDWWKHGAGFCRSTSGLSTSFDFTNGPATCADVFLGQAAGGYAYDVDYGTPNKARLRIQAAIPAGTEPSLNPGTEYYAFKVNLSRAKTEGTGACSGCSTPVTIRLNEIQLFQPLEIGYDPQISAPGNSSVVTWQANSPGDAVGGGINLSWDDCGTAGSRSKMFACDTNTGTPFTLVASFEPPAGVDQFLGVAADLSIVTESALPDWWKHGSGFCRGANGLATNFDFTSGPSTCTEFASGLAAGGYAYDVAYGASNRARLRVQYAVPVDNRGPVAAGTEYYAFKVNLMRSLPSGGSCAGCDVPAEITLNSIQLFQPLEVHFDPMITTPLNSTVALWQTEGGLQPPPAMGPNLVTNPSFETSLAGWGGFLNTTVERVADPHQGGFALAATSPDSVAEFGVNDSPNWIVSVPEAGSRYRFGAWIKSPTQGFPVQLRMREFLLRARTQSVGSEWVYATPNWQYVEFEAAALSAGSTIDFQIVCSSAAARSRLLVDDVSIRMIGSGPFMDAASERTVDPGTAVEIVVTANDTTGEAIRSLTADLGDLPTGNDATFTVDPDRRRGVLRWTPQIEDGGASYVVTFRGRSKLENSASSRITVRASQDLGNLAGDPSFEGQQLWRWKSYQGATLTGDGPGRIGNVSLRALGRTDSASTFGINDSPNIVGSTGPIPGKRYRFTCWVRGDSAAGFARLRVREYLGAAKVGNASYSNDLPLTPSWRKLIVEHVTGAGGSTLDFHVLAEGRRPGVTFFIDDVSIREIAAPPAATPLVSRETATLTFERPTVMPNPFRGHASLALTLTRRGPLKIALYDLNGRRVRNVHEHADAPAGTHRFELDGRNERGERLGPGVFFYRIDSADGVRQGRFVILE